MNIADIQAAARRYAEEVEARADITLSTKSTYIAGATRFIEWLRVQSWQEQPLS